MEIVAGILLFIVIPFILLAGWIHPIVGIVAFSLSVYGVVSLVKWLINEY